MTLMTIALMRPPVRRNAARVLLMILLAMTAGSRATAQIILGGTDTAEIRGTTTALNGSTALAGVFVACLDPAGRLAGSTLSDGDGRFRLSGLPPGTCRLTATLSGFREIVETVTLTPRQVLERALDFQIAGVTETVDVVSGAVGDISTLMATTLGQKEALAGSTLEQLPLRDGSIQAAMNYLPGVVQGREGLSIRGGFPTQSSVQIGAASATEPASGETVIWLPADAVASVEVLPNPYAAEYGRFSSGVTLIGTRQGGSTWRTVFQDFDPTLRRQRDGFGFSGIQAVSPRLFVGGPLVKNRVYLAQSVFYRYESRGILSRPPSERSTQRTASLFTRVDTDLGKRGSISWLVGAFPQRRDAINFDTFNPPDVALNWRQRAYLVGASHSLAFRSAAVLESGVHVHRYRIGLDGAGDGDMVIAPEINSGHFFNTQDRTTTAVEWVESLAGQRQSPFGLHLFKAGASVQHVDYAATSRSRPVLVRRADGTLATSVVFGAPASMSAAATDVGVFLQDRWQVAPRMLLELGVRYDRDGTLHRHNVAPRLGALVVLSGDGAMTLGGGVGLFYERTPTSAAAFPAFETRTITRFAADGVTPASVPVRYAPAVASDLATARSRVWNLEYRYRVSARLSIGASVLDRRGRNGLVVAPVASEVLPGSAALRLDSSGRSSYREAGVSLTVTPAANHEVTVSYLHSSSQANLNAFAVVSGFYPDPIVRPDEYAPIGSNVPNRLVARASSGIGENWRLFAAIEARNGLPYNAVNEYLDIVGPANQLRFFPAMAHVDLAIERRFSVGQWHPWIGIRVWNALNRFLPQDVQRNLGSAAFGSFYNHVPRTVRLTVRIER